MNFLDFRRYVFANLMSVLTYVLLCCLFLYINTDFQPAALSNVWGEPAMIISAEEQKYVDAQFIIMGLIYLSFCLFLFEFFVKFLIFLINKFILKKTAVKKTNDRANTKKIIYIIYSIFFYIGFISPIYPCFKILIETCFS